MALVKKGFENGVWFFKSQGQSFVAKVYAVTAGPRERIEQEVDLYQFLSKQGIRVPVVIKSQRMQNVENLVLNGHEYPFVVMQWEDLRCVRSSSTTREEIGSLGRQLANVHSLLQSYGSRYELVPRTEERDQTTEENNFEGVLVSVAKSQKKPWWSKPKLKDIESIDHSAFLLLNNFTLPTDLTESVIHNDLYLFHIPLLADGTAFLFDWDQCWGPVVKDLAVLGTHIYLSDKISFSTWEQLQEWLLTEYCSRMPLSQVDLQVLRTLMLKRLFEDVISLRDRGLMSKYPVGQYCTFARFLLDTM